MATVYVLPDSAVGKVRALVAARMAGTLTKDANGAVFNNGAPVVLTPSSVAQIAAAKERRARRAARRK